MTDPKQILGHISGGRVLDVATGSGGFIHFLLDGLKDYAEILGIDTNERGATAFAESFKDRPRIRFETRDALHSGFSTASFDTICISDSLHHFAEPMMLLGEMERLLRPGGYLLVSEMYRDHQTDAQLTHVELHHWWAAVDTLQGITHRETYARDELLQLVAAIGLSDLQITYFADTEGDPKDPDALAQLSTVIDRYLERADGHPDLQARGEELRRRLHAVGIHGPSSIVAVGRTPS